MLFIKPNGKFMQYPYTTRELRKDNPNVSFPAIISADVFLAYGAFPVTEVEQPVIDETTQQNEQSLPVQINGVWTQVWKTIQLSEEVASGNVRAKRNFLLKESDWTQGKDISDSISAPWAAYREELRDIPNQEGFPFSVQWPVAPNV